MLKKLLIAVLVLSFVMAFTGTAFSDVYPQFDGQRAGQRFNSAIVPNGYESATPNQPASRPLGSNVVKLPDNVTHPAPPLASFCNDLWYDGGAAFYWTMSPTLYGEDFYNVRYTTEDNFSCTLYTFWLALYGPAMAGTPDMMVYLWDDDGFGNPGTALDSIFVPYASLPTTYTWMGFDFKSSPNAPIDGWVFSDGEEYHYGVRVIENTPGVDEIAMLIDDGTGPNNGQARTSFWDVPGTAWGTMLGVYGTDYTMVQSSEYCAGEIPFTDCYTQSYWANFAYIFSTPNSSGAPITAQAMRFDVGGPETLVSVDVVLYDPGNGAYGDDDVIVSIVDDNAGLPGSTVLFTTTLAAGTYGPGSFNTVPVGIVVDQTFHVTVEVISLVNWEYLGADDGTAGEGRASTFFSGAWATTGSIYGLDVNFLIDANLCRDQFSDCSIESHFGNNWFTWSMGDDATSQFRAIGVQMYANGQSCQVNDVALVFDDYFSTIPPDFTYDTKVSVYTDAVGIPGVELASVTLTPADYNAWPAYTTADFSGLDVYVTGDYWAVIEYLVPPGDPSTIGFNSDDGTFDNGGRSAALFNPSSGLSGWYPTTVYGGTDYGWDVTSSLCCRPFDEVPRVCSPSTDAGWATFQGNQQRTGASDLAVGDAWCNLNLNWSFDGPNSISFTGPVIYGDKAVCAFTTSYKVFDIITGAVLYTLDATAGDGQLLGSSIRCAPTIVNIGGTDIMFASGGSTNGIGAFDLATGAVIWQRTVISEGPSGLFGQTRFAVMTVLNDGVDDVLYFTTDNGAVAAVNALTGTLYAGWATNPVYLTGSPYISGATDGTDLFYASQTAATEGDIYSIDAFTGAVNWTLQGNGGLAAPLEAGYSYPEGFRGGVAYQSGVLYAVSWANDLGISDHPIDGFYYSVNAASGAHVVPPVKTNRAIYSTPVVDKNAVYAPTLSQWASPTDPTGGNLIAFHKTTGVQLWGAKTADDANYYSSGILSCEPDGLTADSPDHLFIFNASGFFESYNTETGEQIFRRRVDHGGGAGEIGFAGAMAMTATDGLHMMFGDFYGGLYDFKLGADRPRMEIQTYQPSVAVEFGGNPALPVNIGPIMVNTGCTDLIIASSAVDELPITGSTQPSFVAGYVADDIMERAASIADYMQREAFLSKFRQVEKGLFNTTEDVFNVRSLDREKSTSSFAAGIPAWFVSLDAPIAGTTILPGDTADLLITVNQTLINRGPQSVYINWDSNDPDFFLNAAADAAGLLPEIKLTIVGGCLTDTTELNFGMSSANIQLVTNTGRLGTGDWSPHGFDIDGDDAAYYQGSYIYGTSLYSIALNTQDWSGGGGEAEAWTSMQADPNYCDNSCKPALTAAVSVGSITSDGGATYDPISADMVCKTYIDSVENFDAGGGWDWGDFAGRTFDDTLTMGLTVNARVIGVSDLPGLANLTLEIMDFTNRNATNVDDWYIGQITDFDVGGDSARWDQSISAAWSINPGGDAAWGSIKIPFGCGTVGAGQDFDYNPMYSIKGLNGASALFDIDAYFDSAYIYLSTPGYLPHQPSNVSDGELHVTYAGHNFTANSTYSLGVANFGITGGLADNASGAELAPMANLVNQWAGFGRGDVNNDGSINLADIIYLAGTVNGGNGAIPFAHLSDVNADGAIDAGDINYLVDYYFNCGPCPMGDWMF